MNRFKLFLFLCGIISFSTISCEKVMLQNNLYSQLPVNSGRTTIDTTINQIEFKFCLLDSTGAPAVVFKEGDNFSFYLSFINHGNLDSVINLDNSFLYEPKNYFCKVFNDNDSLIGLPFFIPPFVIKIGSGAHPFYGDHQKYELTVPWKDDRSQWETLHCIFQSAHQNYLPKGKYYTRFSHRFCFDRKVDQPSLCIDSLNFKINFEIR